MLLTSVLFFAVPTSAAENPLARVYRAGETFRYVMAETTTENGRAAGGYASRADVTVELSSAGVFDEAVAWTEAVNDGAPAPLPPEVKAYRQRVSLDRRARLGLPDLALLGGRLGGPLDLLTFYVDELLAIKDGGLRAAGDRGRFAYGKPASWADGRHVLKGYDCVDFELELVALDRSSATVRVDHVPPPAICGDVPAPWMRAPVADTANNWFQVEKSSGGYETGYAKEFFRVELTIRRLDGAILSATMVNPVRGFRRACRDAALTDCGPQTAFSLERRIALTREP